MPIKAKFIKENIKKKQVIAHFQNENTLINIKTHKPALTVICVLTVTSVFFGGEKKNKTYQLYLLSKLVLRVVLW